MSTYSANKYRDGIPAITGGAKGEVIAVTSYYTHPAASTKLTDGDIVNLVKIPAGHEVVGLTLFMGDLEQSTGALTTSFGLLDAGDAALDTVFVADSQLGRAGGTLGVPATTTMFTTAAATTDKVLAMEVTATATQAGAADAVIGVTVLYAPV